MLLWVGGLVSFCVFLCFTGGGGERTCEGESYSHFGQAVVFMIVEGSVAFLCCSMLGLRSSGESSM